MRAYQFLFLFFALISLNSFAGHAGQPAAGAGLAPGNYTLGCGTPGTPTCAKAVSAPLPPPPSTCGTPGTPTCSKAVSEPRQQQPTQQSNNNEPDTVQRSGVCQSLMTAVTTCEQAAIDAATSCDEDKNSSLQTTLQNVRDTTAQADQVLSATGLNGGCDVVLKATSGLASAWSSFQSSCNEKRSACTSTCSSLMDNYNNNGCGTMSTYEAIGGLIDRNINKCEALISVTSNGNRFSMDMQGMMAQAQACKAALRAKGDGGPCASNPGSLLCQQSLKEAANSSNCSDPSQASNVTCACKGGVNTSACQAAMNNSQKLATGAGGLTQSSNSRLQNAAGKGVNAAPNFDDPAGELGAGSFKPQAADEIGGHMGSSASLGGGGGAGGGNSGSNSSGDAGAGGINTNINGGLGRGGGGGGGAWNGGGSGRAGGGAGRYAGAGGAMNGLPNLNNFRPQMGYHAPVRRDLAGVVGPDGLLGPHADPWQTIKNRYNYEWRQGTLKP